MFSKFITEFLLCGNIIKKWLYNHTTKERLTSCSTLTFYIHCVFLCMHLFCAMRNLICAHRPLNKVDSITVAFFLEPDGLTDLVAAVLSVYFGNLGNVFLSLHSFSLSSCSCLPEVVLINQSVVSDVTILSSLIPKHQFTEIYTVKLPWNNFSVTIFDESQQTLRRWMTVVWTSDQDVTQRFKNSSKTKVVLTSRTLPHYYLAIQLF